MNPRGGSVWPEWGVSITGIYNQLEKVPLIILDDFGLAPLDHNTKLTLLQLLEDRYGKRIISGTFSS